uniref:NS3 n=1 Tax=uncultured densovirus TaxID=748192 RepID=A0A7M4CBI9_9VIRU|nr:NS3 [uncultured densovirus]
MDCVYGNEDCSCSKCAECGLCTNGSQVHRNCMKNYLEDAEVAELMAGSEESLPTAGEEKVADALQSDVPMSAEAYYIEMGETHDEEYRRIIFDTSVFRQTLVDCIPETGIVAGKISISRYLNGSCSLLMYRLMKSQWENIIREPSVSMVSSMYFDLNDRCSYHEWCIPDEAKEDCTEACIKIVDFENSDLSAYIADNLKLFFCQGCDRCVILNFCDWDPKLCSDANAALSQPNVITTMYKDGIRLEVQVKHDGLLKHISPSIPDRPAKRQKTNE